VTSLADLLDQAERATPGARIDLRDRIAAHGSEALPALTAWLATDRLGFFSVRVIAEIAKKHRQPALGALRDAREHAPAAILSEIDDVLARIDPPRRSTATSRTPRKPRTWPNRRLGHPYSQAGSYRVLNTSHHNNPLDDSYMLGEHRAAAFFEPWKRRIELIQPGDIVFLYRNGAGVVGIGQAVGPVRKRAYQGKPEHPDEEFYRDLAPFQHVVPPASAGEIKDVTGHTYSMRGTLFTMGAEQGERLLIHLTGGEPLATDDRSPS
jgi:hypothetical protein